MSGLMALIALMAHLCRYALPPLSYGAIALMALSAHIDSFTYNTVSVLSTGETVAR
jgi:hypothetical protein